MYYSSAVGFDWTYLVMVVPFFILTLIAQFYVKSTFNKYNQIRSMSGMTGAQAARRILDANGLQGIRVIPVGGTLTDNYSPKENVIRLSESTFASPSVAAVGVAAHEAGHALQYAQGYAPVRLRSAILPVCSIGSNLAWPLIMIGWFINFTGLVWIGIILFAAACFFQAVTLPVEFNASSRALRVLDEYGMLGSEELRDARKVLSAAALTYVAALAMSVMSLLRLLLITRGSRRRW